MTSFLRLAVCGCLGLAGAAEAQIQLTEIGRYETGVFDEGAAEISAYDHVSKRLFVVNANAATVDVLDLSNPAAPSLLYTIDVTPFGAVANSVAVSRGRVAVVVEAENKTDPGTIVIYKARGDERPVASYTVGSLPDMVTFTPNGNFILVANEGEPNSDYSIDPEGSITILDVRGDIAALKPGDIRTVSFAAFNGMEDALRAQGIRIYGPGANAAQDLEPEYIAVSHDSRTAYVTLQENNAVAVIDIMTAQVTSLLPLGTKNHASGNAVLERFEFTKLPVLGTTAAGQDILLGGFSGLYFDGVNPANGNYMFITHPDRGPNAEPLDVDNDGVNERPFALPDFQPELVFFELNRASGQITITNRLPLKRGDGTPLTGIANILGQSDGLAYTDEEPVDLFGNALPLDPMGGDLEGIVRGEDGTFWMCDEYRPAIYHFDLDGTLLARYVPEGSNAYGEITGIEALPAVYAQRRANRGFEAIAYRDGRIYAWVQSPLDVPDVANDSNSKSSMVTRILEFDPVTETTTAEYAYIIEGNGSDKIGDAVAGAPGEFYVIERDAAIGAMSQKYLFRINLNGATNLQMLDDSIVGTNGVLESMSESELIGMGIQPVAKELVANLAAAGFGDVDKHEGLAMIHPGLFVILNDNDFQLAGGFDPNTGLLDFNPNPQPCAVALLSFTGNGLDASDDDGVINITGWPVHGLYLPDAIAAYQSRGKTFLVTANEGDAREYDTFAEEARVKNLVLDPFVFPIRDILQQDENLGRLTVTTTLGDLDGDGDYDRLHPLGGRSFTIWSETGELIWDSGDQLEQITAQMFPDDFNSTNDENGTFDNRSDNKGPEPEGVAVGKVGSRTYAFIGLERIGGIMVFDITNPFAPTFVQYTNPRDFAGDPEAGTAGDLGPEGILFVPQGQSPINRPILIVTNEISGTTTIFRVDNE